jgi:hypothetical protein
VVTTVNKSWQLDFAVAATDVMLNEIVGSGVLYWVHTEVI